MHALALLLIATAPLTPAPMDDELYGETYSWMADLDDGTYVLAQMAVTNLGPGDETGVCRVIVVADGATHSSGATHDAWKKIDGGFATGPCQLRAGDGVTMHVETGEATVDIATKSAAKSQRPRTGRVQTDGGDYEIEILAAGHPVTVTLSLDGKKRSHTGRSFMNHSRTNALPATVARRWVRFRAVRTEQPVVVHLRLPPNGGATGFVLGNEDPVPIRDAKLGSRGSGDRRAYRARLKTAKSRHQITTKGPPLFRDAPLEKYGWVGRLLGHVLGNPVTFTYRGTIESGGRKVDGVVEVALID